MATMSLSERIKQESAKLDELMAKKADLDRKIKKSQEKLEKYRLVQNNEKFSAIEKATQGTGVSMDELLAALQSGDLIGLQERIEAERAKAEAEENEDELEGEDGESGQETY